VRLRADACESGKRASERGKPSPCDRSAVDRDSGEDADAGGPQGGPPPSAAARRSTCTSHGDRAAAVMSCSGAPPLPPPRSRPAG